MHDPRLGCGRFRREEVLFEERLEGFVAAEPFVGGILSVGLRVATVPVFWRGQGFAFFVGSHGRASVFLFQVCVCVLVGGKVSIHEKSKKVAHARGGWIGQIPSQAEGLLFTLLRIVISSSAVYVSPYSC